MRYKMRDFDAAVRLPWRPGGRCHDVTLHDVAPALLGVNLCSPPGLRRPGTLSTASSSLRRSMLNRSFAVPARRRRLRIWLRGAVKGAALLFATGCAPMIAHGPVVHPGFSFGASAALGRGPTYENGDDPGPFYLGSAGLHGAYGWQPTSGHRPAVRLAAHGPVAGIVGADLYLQAPRAWLGPAAGGVGILTEGSARGYMPYVQAGMQNARGLGAHVVTGRYDRGRRQFVGYWSEERASVTWLSAQVPLTTRATVHLHGGFARGHVTRQSSNSSTPYIDEDRWVGLGGVSAELHRARR